MKARAKDIAHAAAEWIREKNGTTIEDILEALYIGMLHS